MEQNICREEGPLPDCFRKPADIVFNVLEKVLLHASAACFVLIYTYCSGLKMTLLFLSLESACFRIYYKDLVTNDCPIPFYSDAGLQFITRIRQGMGNVLEKFKCFYMLMS